MLLCVHMIDASPLSPQPRKWGAGGVGELSALVRHRASRAQLQTPTPMAGPNVSLTAL